MSTGEPKWWYDRFAEGDPQIDEAQAEIESLKHSNLELQNEILTAEFNRLKEEQQRLLNPALHDAWEKYQMLLKLTEEDE